MPTTNMSLNEPSVGQTAGPDWATEVNANFETIDQHDHTSGKGVQLTPSALNINSDLEFNGNAAIELKRLTFDSSATGSGTNYSIYQSGGNLYWYNGSGQAVQITNADVVKTTGGSIDGMTGTDAQVLYGSGIYRFEFDTTKTPFTGSKMAHGDILLYKYDGSSGSDAYVTLKYTGSSAGSNNITVPDETGTMLTTSTSFGGNISIAATGGSNTITLDAEGDINLDSNSGIIGLLDNADTYGQFKQDSSNFEIHARNDNKDIIFKQYDGNEVVRMADDRRLYFFDKGGEYIVGDGTDLTVASGGAINLTATTDVVVPANVGITFGTGEKIEGDNTDLTLTSGAAINLNAGTLDLSAQTVDVTLNGAVDALNFDSNTLSIDASNNRIGIGTAAPSQKLEISDSATVGMQIRNNTNSGYSQLVFGTGSSGSSFCIIRHERTGIDQGKLHITKPNDGSGGDAFTIDHNGNVGIGTASPSVKLHVYDSADHARLSVQCANSSGRHWQFQARNDGLLWIRDDTAGANRMVFDSSGNVSIGHASANVLLDIGVGTSGSAGVTGRQVLISENSATVYSGSDSGTWGTGIKITNTNTDSNRTSCGITFEHRASSSGMAGIFSTSDTADRADIRFVTRGSSGIGERMKIDDSGNVTLTGNNLVSGYNSFWDDGVYVGVHTGDNQLRVGQSGGGSSAIAIGNRTITVYDASDERKKNVIGETKKGLKDVLNWVIKDFTWKPEWDRDSKTIRTGAIAQELYKTNPELINKNEIYYKESELERGLIPEGKKVGDLKQDVWGIEWINAIPYLVKAIQELSAKVNALEGT